MKLKYLSVLLFMLIFSAQASAILYCSITQRAACSGTVLLGLQNETGGYDNAHAQLPSIATYNWALCCNLTGGNLGTSCDPKNGTVFLRLSNYTNAHVQSAESWPVLYAYNACISSDTGSINCTYRNDSCRTYETCLLSIASSEGNNLTNAHVASCDHYRTKVCCYYTSYKAPGKLVIKLTLPGSKIYIPGIGEKPTSFTGKWTNPPHWYLADYANNITKGLVFVRQTPYALFTESAAANHTLGIELGFTNSMVLLPFTRGDWRMIQNRIKDIETGEFFKAISPTFSFGLGIKHPIKNLITYPNIKIEGDARLSKGRHKIVVEYVRREGTKPVIRIRKL